MKGRARRPGLVALLLAAAALPALAQVNLMRIREPAMHPQLEGNVFYSGACAARGAVRVEAFSRGAELDAAAMLGERIVQGVLAQCPQAEELVLVSAVQFANVGQTPGRREVRHWHLARAQGWRPVEAEPPELAHRGPDLSTLHATAPDMTLTGELVVQPDLSARGVLWTAGGLQLPAPLTMRFEMAELDRSRQSRVVYIGRGEWHAHGDPRRRCHAPRDGWAWWGTLEVEVNGESRARLVWHPCAGEPGSEAQRRQFTHTLWNFNARRGLGLADAGDDQFFARFNPRPGHHLAPDPQLKASREAAAREAEDAVRRRLAPSGAGAVAATPRTGEAAAAGGHEPAVRSYNDPWFIARCSAHALLEAVVFQASAEDPQARMLQEHWSQRLQELVPDRATRLAIAGEAARDASDMARPLTGERASRASLGLLQTKFADVGMRCLAALPNDSPIWRTRPR